MIDLNVYKIDNLYFDSVCFISTDKNIYLNSQKYFINSIIEY